MPSKRNKLPKEILFNNEEERVLFDQIPDWSTALVRVVCPNCGKAHECRKKNVTRKQHSYCRCCEDHLSRLIDITGNRYGNVIVTGFSHTDNNSSYWNLLCDCGNTHVAEKQNLKKGHTKSCGCAVKNNGCKLFRENHPNWNPHLTDEDRALNRDTAENINWRNNVFARDNYRCFLCSKEGRINAHHIYAYSTNKHLRFDHRNGLTMCVGHHKLFHRLYGKKHVYANDLLDYMNGRYYKSAKDLNSLYNL